MDVWSPAGRLHLRSFAWPDHVGRFRRLNAALEVAERAGRAAVAVDRAPAGAWLERHLPEQPDRSVLTVVWQSITRMYWPAEEVERVRAAVRRSGGQVPLAHVSMEYEDDEDRRGAVGGAVARRRSAPSRHRLADVADHGIPVRLTSGTSLGA